MCKHELKAEHCSICTPLIKPAKIKARPVKVKIKRPAAPKIKVPRMTESQFKRLCRVVREDFNENECGCSFEDAVYDIAWSLLFDPILLAYCEKRFHTTDPILIKECLADNLYG